jgi:hypothetical protein
MVMPFNPRIRNGRHGHSGLDSRNQPSREAAMGFLSRGVRNRLLWAEAIPAQTDKHHQNRRRAGNAKHGFRAER